MNEKRGSTPNTVLSPKQESPFQRFRNSLIGQLTQLAVTGLLSSGVAYTANHLYNQFTQPNRADGLERQEIAIKDERLNNPVIVGTNQRLFNEGHNPLTAFVQQAGPIDTIEIRLTENRSSSASHKISFRYELSSNNKDVGVAKEDELAQALVESLVDKKLISPIAVEGGQIVQIDMGYGDPVNVKLVDAKEINTKKHTNLI